MEWLIGLVVVYFVWRIFFARGTENTLIQKELVEIYMNNPNEYIQSKYNYSNYKDYAERRGSTESNTRNSGRMINFQQKMLSGETVLVTASESMNSRKARIFIENYDDIKKEHEEYIDSIIKN